MMKLNAMGLNIRHDPGFLIDRPNGTGDYLFLIFKTEVLVWEEEQWRLVPAGSFLLYRKNTQQKYAAAQKDYCNHYLHFDSDDEELLDRLSIKTNQPGFLQNMEEMENVLRLLSREQISESVYREENINLLIRLLMCKLAENQCDTMKLDNDSKHLEELTELRSEIYSTPAKYKNIREMAEAKSLSLSHFQALYRECFGISCYEDLLNARISTGKEFLKHDDLSVREIAALCGYENDTCFMRCFKKRTGMTPSEYRSRSGILTAFQ